MNTDTKPQPENSNETASSDIEQTPQAVPAGFEDFDLDDIEVIESKVFAG